MATKRQRQQAARKGARTRKANILRAEGWADEEIARLRLDRKSFDDRKVKQLRAERKAFVEEGYRQFLNIRNPEQRQQVAFQYAREQSTYEKRVERLRLSRLEGDGFTPREIRIKKLATIPFRNPALHEVRKRRRQMIAKEIAVLLPKGQRNRVWEVFRAQGPLFLQARARVSSRDEQLLREMGKDYPYRLLDLYAMGA